MNGKLNGKKYNFDHDYTGLCANLFRNAKPLFNENQYRAHE
jgi:hypothetical protein